MKYISCLLFSLTLLFQFSIQSVAQQVGTLVPPGSGITDGLVMDSQGNLFGCDFEGETVFKVTPDGSVVSFATGFNHPNGMTIGVNDTIYLASTWDHAIFQIAPDGVVQQYGPTIQNPNGVIFEPDSDTLVVTSYALNEIRKLSPDGTITPWLADGEINGPLGLAYDDGGNLYIANFNDGKVFIVEDNSLTLLATVPSGNLWGSVYACGFLTYSSGYLYATGIATNYVYRISLDGSLTEFAGSGIAGNVDGDANTARFSQPNGIVPNATGDTLYVSDYTTQSVRTISGLTNGVDNMEAIVSTTHILEPCYPNPFNPSTTIPFVLLNVASVEMSIFNVLGQEVCMIVNEKLPAGRHVYNWNGTNNAGVTVPSGEYIVRLYTEDNNISQRIVLTK